MSFIGPLWCNRKRRGLGLEKKTWTNLVVSSYSSISPTFHSAGELNVILRWRLYEWLFILTIYLRQANFDSSLIYPYLFRSSYVSLSLFVLWFYLGAGRLVGPVRVKRVSICIYIISMSLLFQILICRPSYDTQFIITHKFWNLHSIFKFSLVLTY